MLKMQKLESLGVLAGGIAHDFNNILTGIMGSLSFAHRFIDDTHKAYKPLETAERASARAAELAQQLLTFSKGGEPVKKVTSVLQLVEESLAIVLRGSNCISCIDIPGSLHAIEADEGQISQAFNNIVINAIQAMPDGGALTVTAKNELLSDFNSMMLPSGTYVKIVFIDQGCGISDADLKKIFDPYFTTKSSGNGLGLASVHSIIRRHGGHISVQSAAGKGATFSIYLPSTGMPYIAHQDDSAPPVSGTHAGGKILVMDDEEIIREMTSDMLEYLAYLPVTCESGAEAITLYKAAQESGTPFVAVIMDLTIPGGMGGKDAAKHILDLDPNACLIVSSGYSNDPVIANCKFHGFAGAVVKPYHINEFGSQISAALAGQQGD
jgi:CheY-like chemotaxis protein